MPAPSHIVAGVEYPRQVDGYTCGIAALATFSARRDQADADNADTRRPLGVFAQYLSAPQKQITRVQDDLHRLAARTGLPWPRFLGTAPWALARLAHRVTGRPHHLAIWGAQTAAHVAKLNANGHDVFVYVGHRGVPRHVVLMLATGTLTTAHIFEPSSGKVYATERQAIPTAWWGKTPLSIGAGGRGHFWLSCP